LFTRLAFSVQTREQRAEIDAAHVCGLGERGTAPAACVDPVRIQDPAESRVNMHDIVNRRCTRELVCAHLPAHRAKSIQ
jgi:hypothetical protein